MAHVVEGPHRRRVVGHERELVAVALARSAPTAPARSAGRGRGPAPGASWPCSRSSSLASSSVTRGNGSVGTASSVPNVSLDLLAVALLDGRQHVRQPALLERHHVLVGVDPRDLHVHARELRVVARGERGVRAEHRARPRTPCRSPPPSPSACRTAATAPGRPSPSKYSTLNSSAPDSLAEPISFGVCSSMKPSLRQNSRIACSTVVCTSKISRRSGRRRSR